jgi:hypothetical protein
MTGVQNSFCSLPPRASYAFTEQIDRGNYFYSAKRSAARLGRTIERLLDICHVARSNAGSMIRKSRSVRMWIGQSSARRFYRVQTRISERPCPVVPVPSSPATRVTLTFPDMSLSINHLV